MASREADLTGRARKAFVAYASRTVVIRGVAIVGNVLIARLITPDELGHVALGTLLSLQLVGLSDIGLIAAFTRRNSPPEFSELRRLLGLQLAVACTGLLVSGSIALTTGATSAQAAFALLLSMPLLVYRGANSVRLLRGLETRAIVVSDITQTLIFFGSIWPLVIVAGDGITAWIAASLIRDVLGVICFLALVPQPVLRPSFRMLSLRPVLGFGIRFQLVALIGVLRDQLLLGVLALLGGPILLGYWALVSRLHGVFAGVIDAVARVALPYLSQRHHRGDLTRDTVEGYLRGTTFLYALLLAPLAATAVLGVPVVLGPAWEPVGVLLAVTLVALSLSQPAWVFISNTMYATGDPVSPALAVLLNGVTLLAGTTLLAQFLPASIALAAAFLLAHAAELMVVLLRQPQQYSVSARFLLSLVWALVVGVAGHIALILVGADLASLLGVGLASLLLIITVLLCTHRRTAAELVRLLRPRSEPTT